MNKLEAQQARKDLHLESSLPSPSGLIELYELDISEIATEETLLKNKRLNNIIPPLTQLVFRFHNFNLGASDGRGGYNTNKIWFNGQDYSPSPMKVSGFEHSSRGTSPRPKLTLSASPEGEEQLRVIKDLMRDLNDLVGAKLTRTKTYARFLDWRNYYGVDAQGKIIHPHVPGPWKKPHNIAPNPDAKFPEDIYYIDRKSAEARYILEFELASAWDLQNIKLPGRAVSKRRCTWTYRGTGCSYEYQSQRITRTHGCKPKTEGGSDKCTNAGNYNSLPQKAPPLATSNDEKIDGITLDGGVKYAPTSAQPTKWVYAGKNHTSPASAYRTAEVVYITIHNNNYYFVAKKNVPNGFPPPDSNYWIADECSKTLRGCELRWAPGVTVGKNGHLPFGGFPATNRGR